MKTNITKIYSTWQYGRCILDPVQQVTFFFYNKTPLTLIDQGTHVFFEQQKIYLRIIITDI
jgi:hypothetical protein